MKRLTLFAVAVALTTMPLTTVVAQDSGSSGSSGSTDEVTFYGHVFGHGLPAPQPSNTEPPTGETNYGLGTFEWCTPAGRATTGGTVSQENCEESPFNKLALFSTAGPVDVNTPAEFQQEGGYAMLHNERGQTKDVQLDTSKKITATLFGTVDFHSWLVRGGNAYGTNCVGPHAPNVPCLYPYWGWDVGVQPEFVVEATMYQADLGSRANSTAAPPVQEAIESGDAEVVAQGQWGPDQALNGVPGAPNAMQFDIDLGAPQTDTISKENDFFLVYRVFSETPAGDISPHTFRWWSGEFFPNSYTMPVENAFQVERVIPNFANGKLAMLGIMNTPWGSYDVDSDSVDVSIEGPTGSVSPSHLDRFASFSVAHGGHFKPVNVTWIWDYRRDDVRPGDYTITVSASNAQGTADAQCKAKFTLEEDDSRLVPGEVQEGVCGTQTASQEFVKQIREGSEKQTGGN